MPKTKTKTRQKSQQSQLPAHTRQLPARKAPTGVSKARHTKAEQALAVARKRASTLAKQVKAAPMAQIAMNSAAIQAGAVGPAIVRGATGIEGVGPVPLEWLFAAAELGAGLYFRQPAFVYAAGGSIAPWSARLAEDIADTLADGGGMSDVMDDLKEAFAQPTDVADVVVAEDNTP